MSEREFWILVRQALLAFVDAIERKYCLGKHKVDALGEMKSVV